eukprot:TRINITY_DN16004_c0_g1_i1.p1 TRINITY_DN16004_c0_g1~~TRINITY_DN16004_c0_g1_i1.p1  ORF type:complete len:652 (+),score=102.42 TRINITY_DN16004_c0_g1_i1:234-2189(+)
MTSDDDILDASSLDRMREHGLWQWLLVIHTSCAGVSDLGDLSGLRAVIVTQRGHCKEHHSDNSFRVLHGKLVAAKVKVLDVVLDERLDMFGPELVECLEASQQHSLFIHSTPLPPPRSATPDVELECAKDWLLQGAQLQRAAYDSGLVPTWSTHHIARQFVQRALATCDTVRYKRLVMLQSLFSGSGCSTVLKHIAYSFQDDHREVRVIEQSAIDAAFRQGGNLAKVLFLVLNASVEVWHQLKLVEEQKRIPLGCVVVVEVRVTPSAMDENYPVVSPYVDQEDVSATVASIRRIAGLDECTDTSNEAAVLSHMPADNHIQNVVAFALGSALVPCEGAVKDVLRNCSEFERNTLVVRAFMLLFCGEPSPNSVLPQASSIEHKFSAYRSSARLYGRMHWLLLCLSAGVEHKLHRSLSLVKLLDHVLSCANALDLNKDMLIEGMLRPREGEKVAVVLSFAVHLIGKVKDSIDNEALLWVNELVNVFRRYLESNDSAWEYLYIHCSKALRILAPQHSVSLARRAVAFAPQSHLARSNEGEAYFAMGCFDEALVAFKSAMQGAIEESSKERLQSRIEAVQDALAYAARYAHNAERYEYAASRSNRSNGKMGRGDWWSPTVAGRKVWMVSKCEPAYPQFTQSFASNEELLDNFFQYF